MKKPSAKRRPVKTSQRAGDDASTSKVPAVARPAPSDAENRQPQPGEKRRPPAPRIKIIAARDGAIHITADHPPEPAIDQILLMRELGTTDIDFLDGLLGQIADVGTQGRKVNERGLNDAGPCYGVRKSFNAQPAAQRFAANVLPLVQQIQASGVQSLRGVARALAARGVKTARGGEWSAVQVADILRRA
jgi:hypothetical protein